MCPIYQYFCEECHKEYEVMKKVKDLPKREFCENCGSQMESVPVVPARFVRGKGAWSSPA